MARHEPLPFLVVAAGLLACATTAVPKTAHLLDTRIGWMDLQEASARFGQPTRCEQRGEETDCLWVYEHLPSETKAADPAHRPTIRMIFNGVFLASYELSGAWP